MKTVIAKDHFDEPITPDILKRAIARGQIEQKTSFRASSVDYISGSKSLLIIFSDQSGFVLPIEQFPELAVLNSAERKRLTLGFGGSALCLEEKDLHISIAGLVAASQPLMKMAASIIAARNGRRSSEAKAAAARKNGLKGGRPRRLPVLE
jgi:hypothetical protein